MTIEEIIRRRKEGAPIRVLARLAGKSDKAIEKILEFDPETYPEKLTNTDKYAMMHDKGLTDREIARATYMSVDAVKMWRTRSGRKPNKGSTIMHWHKKAEQLYMDGLNDREISTIVKKSKQSVWNWRKINELPPNS